MPASPEASTSRFGWRLALCAAVAAACHTGNMTTEPRFDPYEATDFFPDGTSARHYVAGTISRSATPGVDWSEPPPDLAALAPTGHEYFEVFCSPCHGKDGKGNGMVVQRGYPAPPSLCSTMVRAFPAAAYYSIITNGAGKMREYGSRVTRPERWAIAAFVQQLQKQNCSLAGAGEQARHEGADAEPGGGGAP